MSALKEVTSEIDWRFLERQFDGGGNDKDGGGDFGEGLPEEPEDSGNNLIPVGASIGAVAGLLSGVSLTTYVEERAAKSYAKEHHISWPASRPAVESGIYDQVVVVDVQALTVMTPVFILAAAGAMIGHRLNKRFNK